MGPASVSGGGVDPRERGWCVGLVACAGESGAFAAVAVSSVCGVLGGGSGGAPSTGCVFCGAESGWIYALHGPKSEEICEE